MFTLQVKHRPNMRFVPDFLRKQFRGGIKSKRLLNNKLKFCQEYIFANFVTFVVKFNTKVTKKETQRTQRQILFWAVFVF